MFPRFAGEGKAQSGKQESFHSIFVVVVGKWMAKRAAAKAPVHDLAAPKPIPANNS